MAQDNKLKTLFGAGNKFNVNKLETGLLTLQFTPDKSQLIVTWIPHDPKLDLQRKTIVIADDGTGTGSPESFSRCVNGQLGLLPNPTAGDVLSAVISCIGA